MKKSNILLPLLLLSTATSWAGVTISALTSFSGDGWLSPTEYTTATGLTLGTDFTRSMAYNPVTKHLILPVRTTVSAGSISVIDANTATNIGTLTTAGISGGTFFMNGAAADDNGGIYICNLASAVTAANPYKLYYFADETLSLTALPSPAAAVTIVNNGTISTGRVGDSLNAAGGATAQIIAGESTSAGAGTRNSFVVVTKNGATWDVTRPNFAATPPIGGDFRLGTTLLDSDTLIGTQGGASTNPFRIVDFTATTGTLVASPAPSSINERVLDYATVGGKALLATVTSNSTGSVNNTVRIYDMSTPSSPASAVTANLIGASGVANANGFGSVQWGEITGSSAKLFVYNSNNGIQAFTVTVTPDVVPATVSTPPAGTTVFERGLYTMSVVANGSPPFTYQWKKDGTAISGATSSSLTLNPITTASAGSYTCVVNNPANVPAESTAAVVATQPSLNTTALTECWQLSPGSRSFLTNAAETTRGLDYNPVNNTLYVASRTPTNGLYAINGTTNATTATLDVTGVTGGNFDLNMVGVAADSAIYVCNLSDINTGANFRIYRWADGNAGTVPVPIYDNNPASTRIGDTMDVRGSGRGVDGTQILCGTRSNNQFVIFTLDETPVGVPQTVTAKVITVAAASSGAFGLSVAFGEGNTVWGKGSTSLHYCSYDYAAGTGAVLGTYAATSGFPGTTTVVGVDTANRCLAAIDFGVSDNIRLYGYFPNNPKPDMFYLDQEFTATDNANVNNIGAVSVGGGKVYTLDVNNGIACYSTTKPLAPSLGAISVNQTTNEYQFVLKGSPNTTYVVEVSTDLAPNAWTALQTVTLTGTEMLIHTSKADQRKYFRARLGP